MKELFLGLFLLTISNFSAAELSVQKIYEFSQICHDQKRNQEKYQKFCECYKENVRWLINDEDVDLAEKILSGKLGADKLKYNENGEAEFANMLVDIETACDKNHKYIAPKAKALRAKKAKKN